MLVKELIEYLKKMEPELEVGIETNDCGCLYGYQDVCSVIEQEVINVNDGAKSSMVVLVTYYD